jgi:hypothetical protein
MVKEDNDLSNDELSPDYLANLSHNGVPPHVLRLKRGCVCTVMRNLSVRKGLVKNARVIIRDVHRRFIQVQLIDHHSNSLSEIHCLPRIRFEFCPPYTSWTIQRVQFPLRLAYACTFHGCVGLTLDRTVLDLRTQVFAHGQLYTALSRVRHRSHSKILLNEDKDRVALNIVYEELLL